MKALTTQIGWAVLAYLISCIAGASGFVISDGLIFHGSLSATADGISYQLRYGPGTQSLSQCLFLAKIVGLLGLPLAIPLAVLAERRGIKRAAFFAVSGLAIGIFCQVVTLWIEAAIFSFDFEKIPPATAGVGHFAKLAVDFLLAVIFGLFGGLAYWAIAGKTSGNWKQPA